MGQAKIGKTRRWPKAVAGQKDFEEVPKNPFANRKSRRAAKVINRRTEKNSRVV